MKFEVEINFIKKEKELISFDQDPLQHMIHECDRKSLEKRINLERGIKVSYLTPLNVTIEKSINEYILENDSK